MVDDQRKRLAEATVDELVALNREIAALIQGGLPLEQGLRQISADFAGHPGALAARLERSVSSGKTLAEAVAAQGDAYPPIYLATVEAGIKLGRLSDTLERFLETATRVAQLRRLASQAAIYPLLVIVVTCSLFLFIAPILMRTYSWLDIGDELWLRYFQVPRSIAWNLALGLPVLLVVIAAWWWRRSALTLGAYGSRGWLLAWVPGMGRTRKLTGQANFADLLQMMLSGGVGLSEALTLAGNASGLPELEQLTFIRSCDLCIGES